MKVDLYLAGTLVAIRLLRAEFHNPNSLLSRNERLDLEQFIADLQDELDNEVERQHLSRSYPESDF